MVSSILAQQDAWARRPENPHYNMDYLGRYPDDPSYDEDQFSQLWWALRYGSSYPQHNGFGPHMLGLGKDAWGRDPNDYCYEMDFLGRFVMY